MRKYIVSLVAVLVSAFVVQAVADNTTIAGTIVSSGGTKAKGNSIIKTLPNGLLDVSFTPTLTSKTYVDAQSAILANAIALERSRAMTAERITAFGLIAETNRAQVAEALLAPTSALVAETNRARQAEALLASIISLTAETNRAQQAEALLASIISLTAETNRAIQAEAILRTNYVGPLAFETNRAQQAESILATNGAPLIGLTTNAFNPSWYSGSVTGIATGTYARGVLISIP